MEKQNLPKTYKGYSTEELLNIWEEVKKPERDFGSEREDSRHEPDDKRIQARDILENRQRADLTLREIQSPQVRFLPDDLASLKTIWQAELEKFLVPIKAKAAQVEEKLTAMLVRP